MNQILELFGDVEPFLKERSDKFSVNTRAKLIEYFENVQKRHSLKVKLACVADAGKPFVQATYVLKNWKAMDFLQLNVMKSLVC